MLNLVYCEDPLLSEISEEVTEFDDALLSLTNDMFALMDSYEGVGLAAVQVGKPIRVFITDSRKDGERLVFVNPEIIATSDDSIPYNEGCLSVPNVFRDVNRPSEVTVIAKDVKGKSFKLHASGLLARIIQHETDHLNGKIFLSHLSDDEKQKAIVEFRKKNKKLLKSIKRI